MNTQGPESTKKKSDEKQKTVRLSRELEKRLRTYVQERKGEADQLSDVSINGTIQTAIAEFLDRASKKELSTPGKSGEAKNLWKDAPPSGDNSTWHEKLDSILKSRKDDAIHAVQHNIDVFFRYINALHHPVGPGSQPKRSTSVK